MGDSCRNRPNERAPSNKIVSSITVKNPLIEAKSNRMVESAVEVTNEENDKQEL